MSRQMYNAKELSEILQVSEGQSYKFIRMMNEELKSSGFLIVRGKVPRAYVEKRFFGVNPGDLEDRKEGAKQNE